MCVHPRNSLDPVDFGLQTRGLEYSGRASIGHYPYMTYTGDGH